MEDSQKVGVVDIFYSWLQGKSHFTVQCTQDDGPREEIMLAEKHTHGFHVHRSNIESDVQMGVCVLKVRFRGARDEFNQRPGRSLALRFFILDIHFPFAFV